MFSGVDSSAVQSYAQEARDDGGIPASGLSTTERAQGDAAVLASGLSVHSQSRESGEIGGAEENTNQESVQGHNVTETSTASTEAEEKEVSEYSPGLAIRTLTLEDLKEKRTSPELDVSHNTENVTRSAADTLQNWSSEMGMSQLTMSETTTVERKFTITNDTEKRLQELGAQLQKEKVFTDVYYDNDDYALILTDCWLRRRNDAWEVKMPVTSADGSNAVDKPSTQYRELTDEKEISAWLVDPPPPGLVAAR
nr:hypothetical protein BaRGS_031584 [Batillaria attramentaria]